MVKVDTPVPVYWSQEVRNQRSKHLPIIIVVGVFHKTPNLLYFIQITKYITINVPITRCIINGNVNKIIIVNTS